MTAQIIPLYAARLSDAVEGRIELWAHCWYCDRRCVYGPRGAKLLADQFGADAPIGRLEKRFQCSVSRACRGEHQADWVNPGSATNRLIANRRQLITDRNRMLHRWRESWHAVYRIAHLQSGGKMGSFSIWHWLVVLLIFSPPIIGIMVMGLQRSIIIQHPPSGLTKKGFYGYSWTYLIFGWLVPIFRGEIGIGLMHLVLTFVTAGIFQVVMPYLYNRQYTSRQLTSGWVLADSPEKIQQARYRMKIAAPAFGT